MRRRKQLPPPRGVWAALWDILNHPTTILVASTCLVTVVALSSHSRPGEHLAEGVFFRVSVCIIALSIAARASALPSIAKRIGAVLLALGLCFMGWAQWNPGYKTGRLEVGTLPVESYRRVEANREIPVHIGAQLTADREKLGQTSLSLGIKETVYAGPVDLSNSDGVEQTVGEYRMYVARTHTVEASRQAEFQVRPRSSKEWQDVSLAPGQLHALEETVSMRLLQIRDDYLGTLGAAAQIQVQWPEGVQTSWVFVDAPNLDDRVSDAPWVVRLREIKGASLVEIGVRQNRTDEVMWAGLGLALLGLLIGGGRLSGEAS